MSAVSSSKSQRRFLVVFNPTPQRLRKVRLKKLLDAIKATGDEWFLYATEQGLAANGAVLKTRLEGVTDLIVVGGDGTFNITINSLPFDIKSKTLPFRVGLLPSGTGNDFARAWYGKDMNIDEIIDVLLDNHCQTLHLGECEMVQSTRLFHNVMGAGFDAMISKELEHKKTPFRSLSYLWSAIKYIPFYEEPECTYKSSHTKREFRNLLTAFCNSKYFGGGLPIAPMADASSARLDVISAGQMPLINKFKLIGKLVAGSHMSSPDIFTETLNKEAFAQIETEGLELEADGEFIGYSPCKVDVSDYHLALKAPR